MECWKSRSRICTCRNRLVVPAGKRGAGRAFYDVCVAVVVAERARAITCRFVHMDQSQRFGKWQTPLIRAESGIHEVHGAEQVFERSRTRYGHWSTEEIATVQVCRFLDAYKPTTRPSFLPTRNRLIHFFAVALLTFTLLQENLVLRLQ